MINNSNILTNSGSADDINDNSDGNIINAGEISSARDITINSNNFTNAPTALIYVNRHINFNITNNFTNNWRIFLQNL